jgi:hypothetical protein
LEHLRLLFVDNPVLPTADSASRGDSVPHDTMVATLKAPGVYLCSTEGTVGEPYVAAVVVPKIGELTCDEDRPTFYESEDAALVALALPLLREGGELQQDLAVGLAVSGVSGLPRARVALADERSRLKNLPSLLGTHKQVAWASILREELVAKLEDAETSAGGVKRRMRDFLLPSGRRSFLFPAEHIPELELTFAELRAELNRVIDAETWIQGRVSLPIWLAKRAIARRKRPVGEHPF